MEREVAPAPPAPPAEKPPTKKPSKALAAILEEKPPKRPEAKLQEIEVLGPPLPAVAPKARQSCQAG